MASILIIFAALSVWGGFYMIKNADILYEKYPKNSSPTANKTVGGFCIVVGIIFIVMAFQTISLEKKLGIHTNKTTTTPTSTTINGEHTETCQVCNRAFKDDANKKSIRQTNMCKQCYKNFQYATSD